ncbi:phage tail protein [Bacillus sp. Au-Bac7]|uniref:phage tail protein n=1 Tax=Bacillus sp. Au-Bac7 TaxID=2906458 RepID=UPI001E34D2DA|nr:phage tail protein [Bacillus sp. Au-Bac7]MCE4052029.1 phage tail protein [Bacillus sp. Au-Bac7]
MFKGIEFDGKHSYKDFGLTISNPDKGNPSKIKNTEKVPFSNTEYDFSVLYGGNQEYEERTLTYTFNLAYREKAEYFYVYEADVLRWLMTPNEREILKDDRIPGYYFMAEVITGANEFQFVGGSLTVNFKAYPFMISELEEGHDIWDDFNFLLDYSQPTSFKLRSFKEEILFNPGVSSVYPKITATADMKIVKGTTTYNVKAGTTQSYDFFLTPGENRVKIYGSGTISFEYYKELI